MKSDIARKVRRYVGMHLFEWENMLTFNDFLFEMYCAQASGALSGVDCIF